MDLFESKDQHWCQWKAEFCPLRRQIHSITEELSRRTQHCAFYLPARLFLLVLLFGTRCSSLFTSPAVLRFRVVIVGFRASIVAAGNRVVSSLLIGVGSVVWRCGLRLGPRVFLFAHKCFQTNPLHRTRRPCRVFISRFSNNESRAFSATESLFVAVSLGEGDSTAGELGSDCFSSAKSGRYWEWVLERTRFCFYLAERWPYEIVFLPSTRIDGSSNVYWMTDWYLGGRRVEFDVLWRGRRRLFQNSLLGILVDDHWLASVLDPLEIDSVRSSVSDGLESDLKEPAYDSGKSLSLEVDNSDHRGISFASSFHRRFFVVDHYSSDGFHLRTVCFWPDWNGESDSLLASKDLEQRRTTRTDQ